MGQAGPREVDGGYQGFVSLFVKNYFTVTIPRGGFGGQPEFVRSWEEVGIDEVATGRGDGRRGGSWVSGRPCWIMSGGLRIPASTCCVGSPGGDGDWGCVRCGRGLAGWWSGVNSGGSGARSGSTSDAGTGSLAEAQHPRLARM